MNDDIWLKAPKDAEFYAPETFDLHPGFIKRENNEWKFARELHGEFLAWSMVSSDDNSSRWIKRPDVLVDVKEESDNINLWDGSGLPPVDAFIKNINDVKGFSIVILHRNGGVLVEQEDGVAADYILFRCSECKPFIPEREQKILSKITDLIMELSPDVDDTIDKVYDILMKKISFK